MCCECGDCCCILIGGSLAGPNVLLRSARIHSGIGEGGCGGACGEKVMLYLSGDGEICTATVLCEAGDCVGEC